jgi:hypothetical protein
MFYCICSNKAVKPDFLRPDPITIRAGDEKIVLADWLPRPCRRRVNLAVMPVDGLFERKDIFFATGRRRPRVQGSRSSGADSR